MFLKGERTGGGLERSRSAAMGTSLEWRKRKMWGEGNVGMGEGRRERGSGIVVKFPD